MHKIIICYVRTYVEYTSTTDIEQPNGITRMHREFDKQTDRQTDKKKYTPRVLAGAAAETLAYICIRSTCLATPAFCTIPTYIHAAIRARINLPYVRMYKPAYTISVSHTHYPTIRTYVRTYLVAEEERRYSAYLSSQ